MTKVSHFRYALRFFVSICCCVIGFTGLAQTLGSNAAYNFLSFPPSATTTAAGGINISHNWGDVGATFQNPAQLGAHIHGKFGMHFTQLAGGIKALHLAGAYQHQKLQTTFGGHVFFVHYGSVPQTDAAGNVSGSFYAYDYVVQLAAAKQYLNKWQYGTSVKWIQSFYGQYQSTALAADVSLLFQDSLAGIRAGLVAKNMGVQLKKFDQLGEDLPLDVQIGITKKLLQAPLSFSLTAHHLHRFNIQYNDTTFNLTNNVAATPSFFKRLFNHFVLAGHINIGPYLEATIGYNFLRRQELSFGTAGNGLSGFSAGLSARFKRMDLHFSRATYAKGLGYNQLGIQINVLEWGGAGKF